MAITDSHRAIICTTADCLSEWIPRIGFHKRSDPDLPGWPRPSQDQINPDPCGLIKKKSPRIILMTQCKTAVFPLLTHWRYCSLALSHWYMIGISVTLSRTSQVIHRIHWKFYQMGIGLNKLTMFCHLVYDLASQGFKDNFRQACKYPCLVPICGVTINQENHKLHLLYTTLQTCINVL